MSEEDAGKIWGINKQTRRKQRGIGERREFIRSATKGGELNPENCAPNILVNCEADAPAQPVKLQFGLPIDIPTDEETTIINAYHDNHDEYRAYITHEDLKKELNLDI